MAKTQIRVSFDTKLILDKIKLKIMERDNTHKVDYDKVIAEIVSHETIEG